MKYFLYIKVPDTQYILFFFLKLPPCPSHVLGINNNVNLSIYIRGHSATQFCCHCILSCDVSVTRTPE